MWNNKSSLPGLRVLSPLVCNSDNRKNLPAEYLVGFLYKKIFRWHIPSGTCWVCLVPKLFSAPQGIGESLGTSEVCNWRHSVPPVQYMCRIVRAGGCPVVIAYWWLFDPWKLLAFCFRLLSRSVKYVYFHLNKMFQAAREYSPTNSATYTLVTAVTSLWHMVSMIKGPLCPASLYSWAPSLRWSHISWHDPVEREVHYVWGDGCPERYVYVSSQLWLVLPAHGICKLSCVASHLTYVINL